MVIDPKVRAAGLHLGTAVSASVATAMWLSSHSVDLYAIVDQINVVIADVIKLGTTLSVLFGGAYQVYKSTTKQAVIDVKADPDVKGVVMEPTPKGIEIANTTPGPVVVAGSQGAAVLAEPSQPKGA